MTTYLVVSAILVAVIACHAIYWTAVDLHRSSTRASMRATAHSARAYVSMLALAGLLFFLSVISYNELLALFIGDLVLWRLVSAEAAQRRDRLFRRNAEEVLRPWRPQPGPR